MENLNRKIKIKLDEYIGFNSELIFKVADYAEIFGGAIRDIIAGDPIHDIDMMCLSKSSEKVIKLFEDNNYKIMNNLNGKDILSLYTDIKCIFEPITMMNPEYKIIQIIRPSMYSEQIKKDYKNTFFDISERFFDIMKEVDLSCCGVSYNGRISENIKDAILHCKCKVFKEMKSNEMYHPNRYIHRTHKLMNRGWVEFESMDDEKKKEYEYYKLVLDRIKKLKLLETL